MTELTTNEGFRLSPQQRRLWSLQKQSSPCKVQCTIRLTGDINLSCLKSAVGTIIKKHEVLRTKFYTQPELKWPLQVISDSDYFSWFDIDLSNKKTEEQKEYIEKILLTERQSNTDVIVSAYLFNLGKDEYLLLFSFLGMNADTITLNNLVSEIGQDYVANLSKNDYVTEENDVLQYLQFSEWQNQLLEDEEEPDNQAGKQYWSEQSSEPLKTLVAPYEYKNEKNKSELDYNFVNKEIPSSIVNSLLQVADKHEASIESILLTAWSLLIRRITNQEELIIGTAFHGREYEEVENCFGLLAKYLPINISLQSQDKLTEIVAQVQEAIVNNIEWQDYFNYFENLEDTNYPVGFEFAELPHKYIVADVSFAVEQYYVCLESFDISLNCYQDQDKILTNFLYNSNYYERKQVEYLAEQFLTLLESLINNSEQTISQFKIISDRQEEQLLVKFNQTTKQHHQGTLCLHERFTQQAKQTPDNVAVVFEEEKLTYRELNNQAEKLADSLQQLGVEPNVLVGIFLDRSHLSIVAILAVFKAGGAYLPLDSKMPEERLHGILEDAQVQVLLTEEKLASRLPSETAQVLCIDSQPTTVEKFQNSDQNLTPNDLAYVIYTSGSTGKPKGVAVEHRQLCNYFNSIIERLDLPETASFATLSTFSADLGNTIIFSALCTGECLHIIAQERITNPITLAEYFRNHPIDCFKIVPSHLNALLTTVNAEDILPSKLLILGGESLSWSLVKQIQELQPNCRILNHYGPTETTIGVLTFKVPQEEHQYAATVPIGRPLDNTQIYLLDEYLQPVPLLTPGEIYIGGANLSRGYYNRPELTEERFIINPFDQSTRLYKTGDVGRYLPDGSIEFLGRSDRQVKIRGFRIELGEIEAVLSQHPSVKQAVVTVPKDEKGNQRLVAYVVLGSHNTDDLQDFVRIRLPQYMVPHRFVTLKTIPVTANGKIDYKALPAPKEENDYVAPNTPQEETLATIWAEILGLERVSIDDNFFQLGGDSIISIQVISKANQMGLQLTPQQLFEYPTIAQLAAVAKTRESIKTETGPVIGEAPLTPIQHWFFAQELADSHHWNQSVFLEIKQGLDFQVLEKVVKQLLEHHDVLRQHFEETEQGWQQVNVPPDERVPVSRIDLSGELATNQEETIASIEAELQASLNLSSGPLIKVAYFDLGQDTPGKLLIIIHHLVVDGVSWRVLLEDMQTAYQQLSQGEEEINLPIKTTSFKRWAEKLNEFADSSDVLKELEYWQSQTPNPIISLPTDFSFSQEQTANTLASARTISVLLTPQETQDLLQEVPKAYNTQINDVLLTALVQSYCQWTKGNSLYLTLEGHGREDIFSDVNLSRTIGWFTTHFPVLLSLESASSPGDALKTIKEQLRRIPKNGMNYGLLKYINKNSPFKSTPQPELKFNYLGQFNQVFQETSIFQPTSRKTKLDRSQRGSRSYLLEIDGLVGNGQFKFNWTYSQDIHDSNTIESFAENFTQALRNIIAHCQNPEVGGYTPSDFPEAEVSQTELDQLLAKIGQIDG